MSDLEDDIDAIVDDMNPDRIEGLIEDHEIKLADLMRRIENELRARLTGLA